ncbi:MAG TPA: alginate lyase family protein [Blastocatellia bacterium]|nr:alginate lyase family protein [Blastocatellia bacterium]
MKNLIMPILFVPAVLIVAYLAHAQTVEQRLPGPPRVFLLDGNHLKEIKKRIQSGDKQLSRALEALEREAEKARSGGIFSVTTKEATPPSGDKHDYMSQAPYFWPNPATANHLPYIRRDGERNPEIDRISDHRNMDRMVSAVETLALTYYFKEDEACASKAAQLIRAWFFDPATRMNPNLQYAQGIPGINTGRGIGLIETRGMTRVVDAAGLLAGSKAWTDADHKQLQGWFGKFLQWMLDSKNGRDEAAAKNNHGTYFDIQSVSFALFVGKRDLAVSILQDARQKRIAGQIEPDGREPLELARTRSWSYSVGNLDGLVRLAILGERLGVDLWNYRSSDGRSIRAALEFLAPYALGEQKWPNQQITEWQPHSLFPLLREASARYTDSRFRAMVSKLPPLDPADRSNLTTAAVLPSESVREGRQ